MPIRLSSRAQLRDVPSGAKKTYARNPKSRKPSKSNPFASKT